MVVDEAVTAVACCRDCGAVAESFVVLLLLVVFAVVVLAVLFAAVLLALLALGSTCKGVVLGVFVAVDVALVVVAIAAAEEEDGLRPAGEGLVDEWPLLVVVFVVARFRIGDTPRRNGGKSAAAGVLVLVEGRIAETARRAARFCCEGEMRPAALAPFALPLLVVGFELE